jgi:hypothetical protein
MMGMPKCLAMSRLMAVFPTAVGPVITMSVLSVNSKL